jgi:CHASE3 domain sensor protein
MNKPQPSHSNPAGKLAIASLALSIVSLIAYVSIIERASTALFLISTGGALTASIVSLALGLVARKRMRQEGAGSKGRFLVTMSILVAIGYVICLGIVALNVLVYQVL